MNPMNPDFDAPYFILMALAGAVALSMGIHGLMDAWLHWFDEDWDIVLLIGVISFGVAAAGIVLLGGAYRCL